ncbi:MAG: hypothetical protein K8R40_09830 [Anaerolineaceae bacterium]|nr:hypothetical protein [Anaerolineaceae bacterium]
METIKKYLNNPLIAGVSGLVLGLIVGWFIIGWGIWPVQWVDGELSDLRQDIQVSSMQQAIDAYSVNKDANLALSTYAGFGEDAEAVFAEVKDSGNVNEANITAFETILGAQGLPVVEGVVTSEGETEAEVPVVSEDDDTERSTNISNIGLLLGVLLALFLVGIAVFAYIFFIKGNVGGGKGRQRIVPEREQADVPAPVESEVPPVQASSEGFVKQFITEYVYGNDLYDDTFSIDAVSGEFLGECGVGILDTIGNPEPTVTAFEVWLFDKNDVQTVTKVLMTDFAMGDMDIRQRLEVKGEPVQIQPDMLITLETATLSLEAKVLKVEYGPSSLQDTTVIHQMQVEMTVQSKEYPAL